MKNTSSSWGNHNLFIVLYDLCCTEKKGSTVTNTVRRFIEVTGAADDHTLSCAQTQRLHQMSKYCGNYMCLLSPFP